MKSDGFTEKPCIEPIIYVGPSPQPDPFWAVSQPTPLIAVGVIPVIPKDVLNLQNTNRGKIYNMVTTPKITVDFFIFKCLLWLMTQQIWLANPETSRYRAQLIYSNVCYDSWPNKSEQYKKKETFTWHEWHYLKKPV